VSPAKRRRILVIDEIGDSCATLALALELHGHEVRMAANGPSALEQAGALRPDVVLLDVGMPGQNGYDVCRQLRELPRGRSTLIIAQTGWGQPEDIDRAREAGFDFHLIKPVDLAALERLIERPDSPRTDPL
jgi:CheY-like chemotaxis protein